MPPHSSEVLADPVVPADMIQSALVETELGGSGELEKSSLQGGVNFIATGVNDLTYFHFLNHGNQGSSR